MTATNERGLLRALAGMHSEVSRFVWAILDDSVSTQDEIDFGNALVRGEGVGAGRKEAANGRCRCE